MEVTSLGASGIMLEMRSRFTKLSARPLATIGNEHDNG